MLSHKVDIGFAVPQVSRKVQTSWMAEKRAVKANLEIEKLARNKSCK